MNAPWFDPNLYSFIPGTLLGVAGGLIGALTGIMAPRGKGQALVMSVYAIVIIASFGLLMAAIIAWKTGQPYGVWYGLGLPGLLGVIVFGALFPVVLHRYRDAETRRLGAADLH